MALKSVLVLHGPNLNLLGTRETHIYGGATLDNIITALKSEASTLGLEIVAVQSQSESELVTAIHDARETHDAIIINAGAFTHYSWSLHDALRSYAGPVVEVHLSNPGAREEFRHVSVLAPVVAGTISGFGALGYSLALAAVARLSSAS
jgi:3-dehydroquinate dehydratase II